MKCLSLVINESSKREIVELMRRLPEVDGYTIFHGEGHYSGTIQPFESAHDEVLGYVPRIRIDVFLQEADVEKVINQIKMCSSCASRRGLYWTSTVDDLEEL
jgi:nitrogen regulatory protein PII